MDWKSVEGSLGTAQKAKLGSAHSKIPDDVANVLSSEGVSLSQPTKKAALTEPELRLQKLQRADTNSALKACSVLVRQITTKEKLIKDLLHGDLGEKLGEKAKADAVIALRTQITNLRGEFQEIAKQSPEAFLAVHSREMRAWRRQLETGRLVITPFVQEKLDQVVSHLQAGRQVLIHGETGTGKTELGKLAAKAANGKDALVVRGFGGMDSRELFGHMQLSASGIEKAALIPAAIESAIAEWTKKNSSAGEPVKAAAKDQITKAILAQQKVTISEYIIGAVYRAAKEGRTVILDEVNYIPPQLLSKLNDIMTKKPGESIFVQEDGIAPIVVAQGFSIIMTGNVNLEKGSRYQQRFELDLALRDRIQSVEYNYLPQEVRGAANAHQGLEKKQQYAVVLCSLLAKRVRGDSNGTDVRLRLEDRIGSMVLPGGDAALEMLWKLAQFAAVTQQAFAGKIENSNEFAYQKNGGSIGLRTGLALSPRRLISLLDQWKGDGYSYPIDHYLQRDLIDQLQNIDERIYLKQLGEKFGFFSAKANAEIEVVSGLKVFEAIFGSIPERSNWPGEVVAPAQVAQQNAADVLAAQTTLASSIAEADKLLADFKDLFEALKPAETGN